MKSLKIKCSPDCQNKIRVIKTINTLTHCSLATAKKYTEDCDWVTIDLVESTTSFPYEIDDELDILKINGVNFEKVDAVTTTDVLSQLRQIANVCVESGNEDFADDIYALVLKYKGK